MDNSGRRELLWGRYRLELGAAPDSLSDETVRAWLDWRRDERRVPCNQPIVTRAMREIAKASERGWDGDEALTATMSAGWAEPVADWLDNRFSERKATDASGGVGDDPERIEAGIHFLRRACRGGYSNDQVQQHDAALGRVVCQFGNMSHLRSLTERDLEFLERKIRPAYAAELQRIDERAAAGG